MPSQEHEALLMLLRQRLELAPHLLERALRVPMPSGEVREISAELTQHVPAVFQADLALLMHQNGAPTLGILVEVQRHRKRRKRFTWPVYLTSARARYECAFCVLVIATSESVAAWAREPISLGPGNVLTVYVLGPADIPIVTRVDEACAAPELAVLSAMMHGHSADVTTALAVATAAAHASLTLDDDLRALYIDLIEGSLSEHARKAFEMIPQNYQFRGTSYLKGKAEGRAEGQAMGEAQGEAKALLHFLTARGLDVSPDDRDRILACQDHAQLLAWIARAAHVQATAELFDAQRVAMP